MATPTAADFTGKVVFITGAARGIGRATAQAFSAAGAQVVLADIDDTGLTETAAAIKSAGGSYLQFRVDVRVESEIQDALQQTVEQFGGVDIAVNNAGVDQEHAPTGEVTLEEWNRVVDTNLQGTFLSLRHEIPLLQQRGGGSIINISSGAGVRGFPGQPAYIASKHAVVGLTKAAALDYAESGIRINSIAPGIIDTPMRVRQFGDGQDGYDTAAEQEPIGRLGTAEEIAAAALWLASDAAPFTIGHTLVVDGGQTL